MAHIVIPVDAPLPSCCGRCAAVDAPLRWLSFAYSPHPLVLLAGARGLAPLLTADHGGEIRAWFPLCPRCTGFHILRRCLASISVLAIFILPFRLPEDPVVLLIAIGLSAAQLPLVWLLTLPLSVRATFGPEFVCYSGLHPRAVDAFRAAVADPGGIGRPSAPEKSPYRTAAA